MGLKFFEFELLVLLLNSLQRLANKAQLRVLQHVYWTRLFFKANFQKLTYLTLPINPSKKTLES